MWRQVALSFQAGWSTPVAHGPSRRTAVGFEPTTSQNLRVLRCRLYPWTISYSYYCCTYLSIIVIIIIIIIIIIIYYYLLLQHGLVITNINDYVMYETGWKKQRQSRSIKDFDLSLHLKVANTTEYGMYAVRHQCGCTPDLALYPTAQSYSHAICLLRRHNWWPLMKSIKFNQVW